MTIKELKELLNSYPDGMEVKKEDDSFIQKIIEVEIENDEKTGHEIVVIR